MRAVGDVTTSITSLTGTGDSDASDCDRVSYRTHFEVHVLECEFKVGIQWLSNDLVGRCCPVDEFDYVFSGQRPRIQPDVMTVNLNYGWTID